MLLSLRHLEGTDVFGLQNLSITVIMLSAGEAKETLWPKLWVQN